MNGGMKRGAVLMPGKEAVNGRDKGHGALYMQWVLCTTASIRAMGTLPSSSVLNSVAC